MQRYDPIVGSEKVSLSWHKLNDNTLTALTQSAGAAFPTTHLYVGRPCYRTDTNRLYVCTDAATPTWELIWDFVTNSAPLSDAAKKWATARSLTLTGDASGTVSIDGSANVSMTVTVADNSHSHSNYVQLTGDQSISGTKTFTTALAVTGTAKAAGRFYAGTTDPTNTTRTNYDGDLHARAFGTGRFKIEYNADSESLDFNFV